MPKPMKNMAAVNTTAANVGYRAGCAPIPCKRWGLCSVPALGRHHDFVRPAWRELYARQNGTYIALRDSLLPELISGEASLQGLSA
jgi:hypothetical protein